MINRGHKRFLLHCAEALYKLDYDIGITKDKVLLQEYEPSNNIASQRNVSHEPIEWDGISVILNDLVCVDLDAPEVSTPELPPTWKEQTRRGWHFFYRLPRDGRSYSCRPAFRPNLDLLVKAPSTSRLSRSRGSGASDTTWWGHALVAPTQGYSGVSNEMIPKDDLPWAPTWVLEGLLGKDRIPNQQVIPRPINTVWSDGYETAFPYGGGFDDGF